MMDKEGSTKVVNFMTPGAGVLVFGHGHLVKMHDFFSCLQWGMDQKNQAYINDDLGRVYQNSKFHDPQGWGSYARMWPYKSL